MGKHGTGKCNSNGELLLALCSEFELIVTNTMFKQKNTTKPSTISHRASFEQQMDSALAQWEEKESATPDDEWAALQQVIYNTAKTYIGKPDRKHQYWFDLNDQTKLTRENDNGQNEVWGPKKKGPVHLKSRIVARWSDHFQKLLNVPGDIDHEARDNITQRITKTSLDDIPTMAEMARAITCLKDGKAPGGVGIPAEVWKHGGDNLFSRLHQLISNVWECYKWGQARLCTGPRALLHLPSFRDMEDGVYIQSSQSADLFNVAYIRAKTKTTRILMRELLFADDSALVAHSAEEMQKIVDAFSDASKKFGLKIKRGAVPTQLYKNPLF
ncbi:hypothetical protein NP493_605g01083 [Ridgeia piscesae]|uniref:Reverse transcriptase domain-containing protein n=1 Tax=Ridgeia piscesae TaxID=27915 RepID=A0AAD9KTQ0_RIDPI|nr:hypothetical protein NP493_605g01083 [Ridgeia piscesae]